jgi:thioredoxin-like negative regulator of GroEL
MSTEKGSAMERPTLLFFYSARSGQSRRAEGYLAQVLQRRGNHETFEMRRIAGEERPDLFERFRVEVSPTLLVVENKKVQARLAPLKGAGQIERFLAPWLHDGRRVRT